jgi:transposase-like protein
MRKPREAFDRAMQLTAEGLSLSAVARAVGTSPSTVSRWLERAGAQLEKFTHRKVRRVEPYEVQVDELRGYSANKHRPLWAYASIEVWSRLWLTLRVGRRTLRDTILHLRDVRDRLDPGGLPVYLTSDGYRHNEPAVRRVFGDRVVHAQVEKTYKDGRVRHAHTRLVIGSEEWLDAALERSEDSRKVNTSYIERLNLVMRRGLSALHRKTSSPARSAARLSDRLEVLRFYYNFVRRHSALRFGRVTRTPAMQAGLADRPLRFRDAFMTRVQVAATPPVRWGL